MNILVRPQDPEQHFQPLENGIQIFPGARKGWKNPIKSSKFHKVLTYKNAEFLENNFPEKRIPMDIGDFLQEFLENLGFFQLRNPRFWVEMDLKGKILELGMMELPRIWEWLKLSGKFPRSSGLSSG